MTDVFMAMEEEARRSKDPDKIATAIALKAAAAVKRDEIEMVRVERAILRHNYKMRADTNGTLLTFDLHPLEYEAVKLLCPEVSTADWQAQKRAWQWILDQPWAEEFKAAPMEKRYH